MTKYLTLEGLEKFKKELDYLVKVKRKEVSERIGDAASQGDLKENAGYDVAKEDQGFVEGRIKQLKEILSQAKIIEKKESNKIQIGSFVSLEAEEGKISFQVVEPEEADVLQGKISFKSPFGGTILNKKKGDIVKINSPEGKKEYKILEIK